MPCLIDLAERTDRNEMTFEDFEGFSVGRLQADEKKRWVSKTEMGVLWRSFLTE